MNFHECDVFDARVIEPTPHQDERGRFMRAWCQQEFLAHSIDFIPVQANMGCSLKRGTIRGLHYQTERAPEAKLVRCTSGEVFDVVVDLRPASATHGKWYGTYLTPENGRMLYVPPGCAHGFQALHDNSEIYYLTSAYYDPKEARGVSFDDPAFGISWPLPVSSISPQDRSWPRFVPADGGQP